MRTIGIFSLIGRMPSKARDHLSDVSFHPANFSIRVDRLARASIWAAGSHAEWRSRETGTSRGTGKRWEHAPEMEKQQNADRPARPKRVRGFSLIELLVVISIIAILLSLLLPVLNKARVTAKSISCLSRLKQFGPIVSMYADDFSGFFPAAYNVTEKRTWYDTLIATRTIKATDIDGWMFCPAWTNGVVGTDGKLLERTYAFGNNMSLDYIRLTKLNDVYKVNTPSTYDLFADAITESSFKPHYNYWVADNQRQKIHLRHNRKANFFFVDGHAVSADRGELAGWGKKGYANVSFYQHP